MTNTSSTPQSTLAEQRDFRIKLILAYTAVCLIWGSTYLGVRFAIETLPPLLMAGVRFTIAGIIMLIWAMMAKAEMPSWKQIRSAGFVGLMLVTVCNGLFTLAMGRVPSSIGALAATSLPIWMVVLDWLRPNGIRPHKGVLLGVVIGFGGIILLVQPWKVFLPNAAAASNDVHIDFLGLAMMFTGTVGWAVGSIFARHTSLPTSSQMNTAVQLCIGGIVALCWGIATGELSSVHPEQFSVKSLLAFVYLIIFGSITAFTAYSWLLRNVSAALASSYTFVNPIVAMILAVTLGGEHVTALMLLAMVVILCGVAIIARFRNRVVAPSSTNADATSFSEKLAQEGA